MTLSANGCHHTGVVLSLWRKVGKLRFLGVPVGNVAVADVAVQRQRRKRPGLRLDGRRVTAGTLVAKPGVVPVRALCGREFPRFVVSRWGPFDRKQLQLSVSPGRLEEALALLVAQDEPDLSGNFLRRQFLPGSTW